MWVLLVPCPLLEFDTDEFRQLTLQVRTIAVATKAVAKGDLTQKIRGVSVSGEMLELVKTINDMIDQLHIFAHEVRWRSSLSTLPSFAVPALTRSGVWIGHQSRSRSRNAGCAWRTG
jgi:hypothetical protein